MGSCEKHSYSNDGKDLRIMPRLTGADVRRFTEIFEDLDCDGNGWLYRNQILNQTDFVQVIGGRDNADIALTLADKNGDNKINFREFLKLMSGDAKHNKKEFYKKLFKAIDTGNNGYL